MVIKQKNLIEFQIYYLMVVFGLIQVFGFPQFFQYVLDINVLLLFLLATPKLVNMLLDKIMVLFNVYLILLMMATVVVALIRLVPIGQVAWAGRNNYFYLYFFMVCCYTLKTNDVIKILNNVCKMQVVNCIFVAFEYLILNKKNDYLGGMFGVEHGCNGSLNIYLVIICAYAICRFATKNASLIKVALIILSSVVIAGLSEIKFFYIELAVIILLFVLINRLSFKNVVAIIIGAVALYVAYKVMFSVNNDSLYVFTNLDNLKDYSSNDYGNTRISRTAPISQINTWFFGSNKKYQLFGYGFGACEESKSFSWANSSFASVYGTLQYRNLSASMLYIELGWTGLIAFTLIFVFAFFLIQSKKKYCKQNIQLAIFSQIICVMAIMNMWYNSEIRLSIAYLTYLSIAGATICIKDGYKRSKSEQAIELARLESAQIKGAN